MDMVPNKISSCNKSLKSTYCSENRLEAIKITVRINIPQDIAEFET